MDREPKRLKNAPLVRLGNLHSNQPGDRAGIETIGTGRIGHRTVDHDLGRLATADVEDHPGRNLQARQREGGVHTPLEAVPRIGVDTQGTPGGGNGDRVPIGRLEEHIRRVACAARRLAAHDTGKRFRPGLVGDHHHPRRQGIGLAIQRQQRFAFIGCADVQSPGNRLGVKDVQGPVEAKGEEIGDIHQRRNRSQADGLQSGLHPVGRRSVADPPDHPTGEQGTSSRLQLGCDGNCDGARKPTRDRRHVERLKPAEATCRQIARKSSHTKGVGPVRGYLHMDHGIVHAPVIDVANAKRRSRPEAR